jgi:hypothetical protein
MNKKMFGIGLVITSIIISIAIYLLFSLQGQSLPVAILAVPAVIGLLGIAVLTTNVLVVCDLDDEVENFGELVADDVDDLKHFRITRTWIYTIIAIAAVVIDAYLYVNFNKFYASWGEINVFIVGIISVLFVLSIGLMSDWFQDRFERLDSWQFIVACAGLILSIGLGLYFTEPAQYNRLSRSEQTQLVQSDSYWASNRISSYHFFSGGSSNISSPDIDCHGKGCGGIVIIVLVIICIIGSAFIPHFWVVASMTLTTVLVIIALRELLYRPRKSRFLDPY